ncbi:hypothetical protein GIB67_010300 [Kingdonia uniflora]|uniref:Uncharacterized protein n=1 Tax=Kingdonia uniflora TaxID=39325 RepID=A0A7J7LD56_9MAGN|nr:hypothetical protein GIB67_010300 [Kingdonia uniflora]
MMMMMTMRNWRRGSMLWYLRLMKRWSKFSKLWLPNHNQAYEKPKVLNTICVVTSNTINLKMGEVDSSPSKSTSIDTPGNPIAVTIRYPNPSEFTYEKRFFCPFEYALQPPNWYKPEHIAVNKPELPSGVSELKQYDGPQCFVIPGNHDWFDGLHTFMRFMS